MRIALILVLTAIMLFFDFLIFDGRIAEFLPIPSVLLPVVYFSLALLHFAVFVLLMSLWSRKS